MNKKQKQLKRLAEKHYFCNYKLTSAERNLLENSKYKHVLNNDREYFEFKQVLENFIEGIGDTVNTDGLTDEPITPIQRGSTKIHQASLPFLKDLIDEIDDAFFVGVGNFSLDRYTNIDINMLRTFISNYLSKHAHNVSQFMVDAVKKALQKKTPWAIINGLRMISLY